MELRGLTLILQQLKSLQSTDTEWEGDGIEPWFCAFLSSCCTTTTGMVY